MKAIKIILLVSIGLVLMSCSKPVAKIDFANVCDVGNKDKEVSVEGFIVTEDKPVPCLYFAMRPRRCSFKFVSKPDGSEKGFVIHIPEGSGNGQVETPDVKNNPTKITSSIFKQEEIKFRANDGSIVTAKDKITVTGKVSLTDETSSNPICSVMAEKVEK